MSTAISVWSRVITPGQDALISEEVSINITNITLEFDESKPASEKRSVLKMQHLTANPALLRAAAAAGYDSDMDSEIDSDEFGEFDEDDEDEEEDDEDMADTSKVSKASKASTSSASAAKKAPKVNGDVSADLAAELEGDDDDEEDSDEEFDEEFERQEAEVQICSLLPGKVEQFSTNLILPGDEDFVFKLSGAYKVHLFGHYIMQPVPGPFDEPPSGYDSDAESYDSELDLDEDDEDLEEIDEDDSRFMEIEDAVKPSAKKAAKEIPAATQKEAAPAKAAVAKAEATPVASTDSVDKSKLSKNQLKKLAAKEKAAASATTAEKPASKKEEAKPAAPAAAAAATPATSAAKKAPSKKQTLPSGLVIEDSKAGAGPTAKSGARVQMRYVGRLANGKIFDQNTKGAPFSFKLGKGEVIKGWDEGIAGMQVGGERRLVIPPGLAYGKQAISGIPPNSTLTFEVKLLAVK